MNTKNKAFDLYIDRGVVDKVNFKNKDLLCILALALEHYKNQGVFGDEFHRDISCTPEILWRNIIGMDANRTDRKKFIDSLERLKNHGLITIDFKSDKDVKIMWNTYLEINAEALIHNPNNSFIMVNTVDINSMCVNNYNTLTTLVQCYVSIVSYFDMSQIREFDEAIKNKEKPIDYSYDLYGKIDLHISCWASHDRLMTTKHSSDKSREQWITKPTLIKMLNLLEEIGLISIVKTNINGKDFSNHYCYPRHKKYVEMIAKRMAEQQDHARKH